MLMYDFTGYSCPETLNWVAGLWSRGGQRERERESERERERYVLFNDALNTFIYGYMASDIIMVKDHSDSEKGNPLPPHRLLLSINSKGSVICTIPQTG